MLRQGIGLLAWLAVTFLAAAIGAWGSMTAPSFYQSFPA